MRKAINYGIATLIVTAIVAGVTKLVRARQDTPSTEA